MNKERRLAVLEAFASSQPYEFDGFLLRWEAQHPIETIEAVTPAPVKVEKPEPTITGNVVSEASGVGITMRSEPKKRKKPKIKVSAEIKEVEKT